MTKAVINILSFNFFSKSFQSSSLDHFQLQIMISYDITVNHKIL